MVFAHSVGGPADYTESGPILEREKIVAKKFSLHLSVVLMCRINYVPLSSIYFRSSANVGRFKIANEYASRINSVTTIYWLFQWKNGNKFNTADNTGIAYFLYAKHGDFSRASTSPICC